MNTAPRRDVDWLHDQIALALASWKLVIIGTATLTAVGITGMLWLVPTTYSAQMILPLTPSLQAMIKAGVIGDPGTAVTQLPPNSALYSVSVSALTAEEAEASVKRALDQIIERSKPTRSDRAILLNQIEFLKSSIAAAERARQAVPLSLTVEIQQKLIENEAKLAGLSADDVILPPTKAARSERPRLSKLAIIFLASSALMILLALLRPRVEHFRQRIASRFV